MAKPSAESWSRLSGTKRLAAEFKAFQRVANDTSRSPHIIDLNLVDENLSIWRFRVKNFDEDVPAGKQLNNDLRERGKKFPGQDNILMEIRFPPDYPTSPFFLRVVSPRCIMYTGHVTAGGSICIEALVPTGGPGGWRSDYGVEGLLVLVFANMLHAEVTTVRTATGPGGTSGPLRVDLLRGRLSEYSMAEAQAAFGRTMANHGWSSRGGAAAGASGNGVIAAALPPPGAAGPWLAGIAATVPPAVAAMPTRMKARGRAAHTSGAALHAAGVGAGAAAEATAVSMAAAVSALGLPAVPGSSPAHRTRARKASAMQPPSHVPAAGSGAAVAGLSEAPLAAGGIFGGDTATTGWPPNSGTVGAQLNAAAAAGLPIAAAAADPSSAAAAARSGSSHQAEIIVLDDDDDDDDNDAGRDGPLTRPNRRKQAQPQQTGPRAVWKRHRPTDDEADVVIIDAADGAGANTAAAPPSFRNAGPPARAAAARQSRKRRNGGDDTDDDGDSDVVELAPRAAGPSALSTIRGGGGGGMLVDVANLVSGAPNGRVGGTQASGPKGSAQQGAVKAPAVGATAAGQQQLQQQPQQRGAQVGPCAGSAGGSVDVVDLTRASGSPALMEPSHLSTRQSGRVTGLSAAAVALRPAAKRTRKGAADQAGAAAAPTVAGFAAVRVAAGASGGDSTSAVAAAAASMTMGPGSVANVVAAAAAAEAQLAADAAMAAMLAQLEETKAKLEEEQRSKKRLEEKMQDLAAQALLAKGSGGGAAGAGASSSAGVGPLAAAGLLGAHKSAATSGGHVLLAAPPPPHWEPLRQEEGFGVKMVVLPLEVDPLAGSSSVAAAGSSSLAAPAPLNAADIQSLVDNGLSESDATDLLRHCNGSLDEALTLALEASECGGIISLLNRQRQAAAAASAVATGGGAVNGAAQAAAKAAAEQAELERVLSRFEKASGLSRKQVVRVERVQNWRLWTKYCMRRSELEVRARDIAGRSPAPSGFVRGQGVNEFYMWHGTSDSVVELVVKDGFDSRESSRSGALGEGIYFAANANYSVAYTKMRRSVHTSPMPMLGVMAGAMSAAFMGGVLPMPGSFAPASVARSAASRSSSAAFPGSGGALMLCRVALGAMALGGPGIRKPPPGADSVYMANSVNPSSASAAAAAAKHPGGAAGSGTAAALGGATSVDPALDVGSALGDNLIAAVFDNAQAYPEYVVHFNKLVNAAF